jgi:hypothetical protein
MSSVLARCALAIALLGWVAVANERFAFVTTSFAHFYAYAIPVFAIAAAAIVFVGRAFKDTIASDRSGWHLIVLRAVPQLARVVFLVLVVAAFGYIFVATNGSANAPTWAAADPDLRSALFAGFTIPPLLAWVALLASARVSSREHG